MRSRYTDRIQYSILVKNIQNQTYDRLKDKPTMLFEDDVVSHPLGQVSTASTSFVSSGIGITYSSSSQESHH